MTESYSMQKHSAPLHRHLARSSTHEILKAVWAEARQHNGKHLDVAMLDTARHPLPWELELVAREALVIGGASRPQRARKAFDLRVAINLLRDLNRGISNDLVHSREDALAALSPEVHQQVRWSADDFSALARYLRIFRRPKLSQLVEAHLGMALTQWAMLGLCTTRLMLESFAWDLSVLTHLPGISPEVLGRYLGMMAADVETVGADLRTRQSTGRDWAFTFNAMRERPLLFRREKPGTFFAPVPHLIQWRLTDSLYFELVKQGGSDFSAALGSACELYVGEVLERGLRGGGHDIQGERRYRVGKDMFDGADWRVSDDTGHLFIECKARRMGLPAKTNVPGKDMNESLDVMAGLIAQNYRNIHDALQGHVPGFDRKGLPVFCVVATLEDWSLHLPQLRSGLKSKVPEKVREKKVPLSLIEECPYSILSFALLERLVQDIAKSGVARTFRRGPGFSPARYVGCLFPETMIEVMPEIFLTRGEPRP